MDGTWDRELESGVAWSWDAALCHMETPQQLDLNTSASLRPSICASALRPCRPAPSILPAGHHGNCSSLLGSQPELQSDIELHGLGEILIPAFIARRRSWCFFFFFFGNTLRKQGRVVGRGVVMFSGSGSSREVELCLAPGLCRAGTSDEEVT